MSGGCGSGVEQSHPNYENGGLNDGFPVKCHGVIGQDATYCPWWLGPAEEELPHRFVNV